MCVCTVVAVSTGHYIQFIALSYLHTAYCNSNSVPFTLVLEAFYGLVKFILFSLPLAPPVRPPLLSLLTLPEHRQGRFASHVEACPAARAAPA